MPENTVEKCGVEEGTLTWPFVKVCKQPKGDCNVHLTEEQRLDDALFDAALEKLASLVPEEGLPSERDVAPQVLRDLTTRLAEYYGWPATRMIEVSD